MHPTRRMQPIHAIALLSLCLLHTASLGQGPNVVDEATARTELENKILQLEARHGLYGVELSEAYAELGRTLHARGELNAAIDAYNKALQALRVGYGLNDLRQLPVLRELRAVQEEQGNWNEVHAMHYLAFNIAMRNADEDLRVRTLRELGQWLRRAGDGNLVSGNASRTSELIALYEREVLRLEQKDPYEGRNLHLASLYLDLASTELDEAKRKYELPITAFHTPGLGEQRTAVEQTCSTGLDRAGRVVTVCTQPMVVPNMNYYLAPNAQKAQEIRSHLVDVENTALKAFNVLMDESDSSALQTELLDEMRRITDAYNDFIQEQRNQETTLR
jgi:tetratricopeptide (TPR) repeat protein